MKKNESMHNGKKEILTKKEVSQLLGVHLRTVDRLEEKGTLKGYPLAGLTGRKFYRYSEISETIFGENTATKKARA